MVSIGIPPGQVCLLILLSLTVIIVMTGESMLTAALPDIEQEFSVPGIYESLILPIVLLVGAAASPFVGTAGDMYGHKRLLILCLTIYLCGLFFGLFAPDLWILLIGRGLQGAGIAAFPLAYAIIKERFQTPAADTGIGVISAMYGAGTFIGVITGSMITGFFSWRINYLLLIPLTFILLILIYRFIEDVPPLEEKSALDWSGFFSLLIFLLLGLMYFSHPHDQEAGIIPLILLVLCIPALLFFIRSERRAERPLADYRLIRKRPVAIFMIIGFLTILVFFMLLQVMPFVIRLPSGLSLTPQMVGLILIPGTLCDMIGGPLTGRMIPIIGCRIPCVIGSVMLLSAGVILFTLPLSFWVLVIAWMLFSTGMSVVATADLIGVMDYVSVERTAEATGIIQSMQTLGGMAGPVLTGFLLSTSEITVIQEGKELIIPETGTFYLVFGAVALISILLILIAWLFMRDDRNVRVTVRSLQEL